MILIKTADEAEAEAAACKDSPEMGVLLDQLRRDGVLRACEALRPSRAGARVRRNAGGDLAVVDGPFAEAKELIGGFAVVDVPDRAAAVDVARRILDRSIPGTSAEVREVAG